MIVLDASAAVSFLLVDARAARIGSHLRAARELHAPHLFDVEVSSTLRRLVLAGELAVARADRALKRALDLPLIRWPHVALLPRMWSLRHNVTSYDATYVALAEHLGAALLTLDGRLGHAASASGVAVLEPT